MQKLQKKEEGQSRTGDRFVRKGREEVAFAMKRASDLITFNKEISPPAEIFNYESLDITPPVLIQIIVWQTKWNI